MRKDIDKDILDYLFAIQAIEQYKEDADDWHSPYQLEMRRIEMHKKLFDNLIYPLLSGGTDENDAFLRSKELFGNLDKIWKIYDSTEFDIKNDNCLTWMGLYLQKFLVCRETLYFIEGTTQYIHGIHI